MLREAEGDERAVLVATGSEVWVAIAAAEQLEAEGIGTRVVSMPSWELFDAAGRRVPRGGPAARPAERLGRGRHLDGLVQVRRRLGQHRPLRRERPGGEVLEKLGITPDHAADKVRELLAVAA